MLLLLVDMILQSLEKRSIQPACSLPDSYLKEIRHPHLFFTVQSLSFVFRAKRNHTQFLQQSIFF